MKKILVISDIHGSYKYLNMALSSHNDYEKILILGDLYYHGPRNNLPEEYSPKDCASLLNSLSDKLIVVKGNCDAEVDQMISNFPINDFVEFTFGNLTIYANHGHHNSKENIPCGTYDLYLYGHYHKVNLEKQGNKIIASPGSISLPKDDIHGFIEILDDGTILLKNLLDNSIISKLKD